MSNIVFPKDFVWGVASSAYQIEGAWNKDGKGVSIWDTFTHIPGKIINNENGDVAIDHYHRYKEDVDLMAELGLRHYRFSTAWTRILPSGNGALNPKGVAFYDRLVDTLLKNKIKPYLCLFHWDLPQVLQDKGGWANRDTAFRFAEYSRVVAQLFGNRLEVIITHNEPWVAAFAGYYDGMHAPGIKDISAAIKAQHHLLLSHGLAVQAIRSVEKNPIQVGIVLNFSPVYPASNSRKDTEASDWADSFMLRMVLDPLLKGTSPLQESKLFRPFVKGLIQAGDMDKIRSLDLLGINYYSRLVMKHSSRIPLIGMEQVQPEGNEYSGMWEIFPEGLYTLVKRIQQDYAPTCEMMVTENGVPVPDGLDFDGRVRDERRIRYIKNHLFQLHRAIKEGIPIKGYFYWSFLDNFEWALGYGQRFGLVYVDRSTQKRTIKDSGRWFAGVLKENGLDL